MLNNTMTYINKTRNWTLCVWYVFQIYKNDLEIYYITDQENGKHALLFINISTE